MTAEPNLNYRLPDILGGECVRLGNRLDRQITVYVLKADGSEMELGIDFTDLVRIETVAPPKPQHWRVGPGKCFCGFNAYAITGLMVDYYAELLAHLDRYRA